MSAGDCWVWTCPGCKLSMTLPKADGPPPGGPALCPCPSITYIRSEWLVDPGARLHAARALPLIAYLRGMCSDEEPHELIDRKLVELDGMLRGCP